MTKAVEDVRLSAAAYLQKVVDELKKPGRGGEIQSLREEALFTRLTGALPAGFKSRHEYLRKNWDGGGKVTTCMEFVIEYGKNLGYSRGTPGGYMGSFYVDTSLATLKPPKGHAWVPNAAGKRPKDGDVVLFSNEPKQEHIGITFTLAGDKWVTLESGQGPIGKYDSIKKFEQDWGTRTVKGWVDIDLYFSPAPMPAPTPSAPSQQTDGGTTGSLWINQDGDVVHPDAPTGGGGPGYFNYAGTLNGDLFTLDMPHPWAPATRHLDPLAIRRFTTNRGKG